jgi:hypothetical protein
MLGDVWSVVHLNPKISNSALQLAVAAKELNRAEVAGLADRGRYRLRRCGPRTTEERANVIGRGSGVQARLVFPEPN